MRIQDWPITTRPYEKMLGHGSQVLSDAELLAIVIGSGYKQVSAYDVAHALLCEHRNLDFLHRLSIEELQHYQGIGPAKAIKLKAVAELSLRLNKREVVEVGTIIDSPRKAIAYLEPLLAKSEREELYILMLDVRKKLIRHVQISVGSLASTAVIPRDIFRPAIKANAHSIILSHNHPSGNPEPSEADISTTKKLVKMGEALGIGIVDHIIIGNPNSISLREHGFY